MSYSSKACGVLISGFQLPLAVAGLGCAEAHLPVHSLWTLWSPEEQVTERVRKYSCWRFFLDSSMSLYLERVSEGHPGCHRP